jgi:hypothetical protein
MTTTSLRGARRAAPALVLAALAALVCAPAAAWPGPPVAVPGTPPTSVPTAADAPGDGAPSDDAAAPPAQTTWALRPAGAEGADARVSLRHEVEPGGAASDVVALTNFSARPATFAVYASDGLITDEGLFDLLAPGDAPSDGGAWIAVGPVEGATARPDGGILLDVPAGETVLVPVEIRVPANATPGDHPAGVVAELVRGEGGGVQLAARVGVRVHLRVAGDVVARLEPQRVTATYTPSWNPFAPGTVTVTVDVANAGNVRMGADTAVRVEGPWGVASAEARVEQREVLPGQAVPTTVEIPVAPLVRAWGEVVVTPGVVGEDVVDGPLQAGSASFALWVVPWSQLALLAAVVGLVLLVRGLRRRSARIVQARIDAAVAAATAAAGAAAGPRPRAAPRAPPRPTPPLTTSTGPPPSPPPRRPPRGRGRSTPDPRRTRSAHALSARARVPSARRRRRPAGAPPRPSPRT